MYLYVHTPEFAMQFFMKPIYIYLCLGNAAIESLCHENVLNCCPWCDCTWVEVIACILMLVLECSSFNNTVSTWFLKHCPCPNSLNASLIQEMTFNQKFPIALPIRHLIFMNWQELKRNLSKVAVQRQNQYNAMTGLSNFSVWTQTKSEWLAA